MDDATLIQMPIVEVQDLRRDYHLGSEVIHALNGLSFSVEPGSFVSVMGPSGSGKSTLLHLLGGLDHPSSGRVVLDREPLDSMNDEELTSVRRSKLGFIFQFFNLLPTMTAWENVALPRLLEGERLKAVRPRAIDLLARVGLGERVDHKPGQLSGGEMQRVAVARSLISEPILLLADEPTGNLDSRSGSAIIQLLRSLVDEGRTLIMVTHDARIAQHGDRILMLEDGRLVGDASLKNESGGTAYFEARE